MFVANLQLAHDKKALEMKTVGQVLQEAEQVANFYASMMSNLPPDDEGVDEDEVYSNPSHPRQCSFTFSSGETDLAREASIEEAQLDFVS